MKSLIVQDWLVEIDPEQTREYYRQWRTSPCECLYCRNYRQACATLPQPVEEFLALLGVDLLKGGEVFELGAFEDETHRYGGFYHLCGRILEGPVDCKADWDRIKRVEIDNFRFGFSADLELVPGDFPAPVIQLEFEARLPWLLEDNPQEEED